MEEFFQVIIILFMAMVVHEYAHAWTAYRLGDPTARMAGRMTLNPFKHIDPIGTVILPILLVFLRSPFVFGWAKPVPINVLNLQHPKRDMIWVGAAGPMANFLIASLIAVGLRVFSPIGSPIVVDFAKALVLINLVLGTFNLIPIPPLDGSRVLVGLLPLRFARPFVLIEQWGIALVMLLLYLGFMERVLWPVVTFFSKMLGI